MAYGPAPSCVKARIRTPARGNSVLTLTERCSYIPPGHSTMSTTGAFKDVIKPDRQDGVLPVEEFLAGLDRFIDVHNPYRQNKVIPAIGNGTASMEVVRRYAKPLYVGLANHYGVRVKDLEVHAYAEQEHGDRALELMHRVCLSGYVQRRVRQAVEHTILTNEWRALALNRWLEE